MWLRSDACVTRGPSGGKRSWMPQESSLSKNSGNMVLNRPPYGWTPSKWRGGVLAPPLTDAASALQPRPRADCVPTELPELIRQFMHSAGEKASIAAPIVSPGISRHARVIEDRSFDLGGQHGMAQNRRSRIIGMGIAGRFVSQLRHDLPHGAVTAAPFQPVRSAPLSARPVHQSREAPVRSGWI
jgi:hypothetical protein